jgi:hypothetical protein
MVPISATDAIAALRPSASPRSQWTADALPISAASASALSRLRP